MEIICGIYKITSPSGKIYIGQSVDIHKRWKEYSLLKCKIQRRLFESLKKHTPGEHIFEIIEECCFDFLNKRERYYQDFYKCDSRNGLNCFLVNTSELKAKFSEETLKKMSESRRKRITTEETKKKMSLAMSGVKKSRDHVEKVRQKLIGYKHSDQSKLNMSVSLKGRKISDKDLQLRCKQVLRVSDGKVFNSAKDAYILTSHSYKCFVSRLSGSNKVNDTDFIYVAGKTYRGQRTINN